MLVDDDGNPVPPGRSERSCTVPARRHGYYNDEAKTATLPAAVPLGDLAS